MSERDFEAQLERLYRQTPALSDERAFLRSLEARIESEARRRRSMLTACGLFGACVSLGVLSRFEALRWVRVELTSVIQMFERLLTSMEIVHFAALGAAMLVIFALRELERIVGGSSD